MKRSKYHKILATICWIVLIIDLSVISVASWYTYVSIICCLLVIYLTSIKTYKRKLITLFLLILYKKHKNKNYFYQIGWFCSLINENFDSFKVSQYFKNKIEYIKPIVLIEDPFYKTPDYLIWYWFKAYDWKVRIDYLKTILKE